MRERQCHAPAANRAEQSVRMAGGRGWVGGWMDVERRRREGRCGRQDASACLRLAGPSSSGQPGHGGSDRGAGGRAGTLSLEMMSSASALHTRTDWN